MYTYIISNTNLCETYLYYTVLYAYYIMKMKRVNIWGPKW